MTMDCDASFILTSGTPLLLQKCYQYICRTAMRIPGEKVNQATILTNATEPFRGMFRHCIVIQHWAVMIFDGPQLAALQLPAAQLLSCGSWHIPARRCRASTRSWKGPLVGRASQPASDAYTQSHLIMKTLAPATKCDNDKIWL